MRSTAISADPALIERLHALPGSARFTPTEAAVYLNTRLDLLRAWRCQQRGPAFQGRGHFIRYLKSDLDTFMAGHTRSVEHAA